MFNIPIWITFTLTFVPFMLLYPIVLLKVVSKICSVFDDDPRRNLKSI